MRADELRLADTIDIGGMGSNGFTTAIVKQVTDTQVTLFRPYGATADFEYTGGVICYVGIEEYQIPRDGTLWHVYSRKELK